jgi:hypothetical protein
MAVPDPHDEQTATNRPHNMPAIIACQTFSSAGPSHVTAALNRFALVKHAAPYRGIAARDTFADIPSAGPNRGYANPSLFAAIRNLAAVASPRPSKAR